MKSRKISGKSMRTLLVFSVLLGIAIVISIIHKTFVLISESTFDEKHIFNVAFVNKETKQEEIVSFQPDIAGISILHIKGKKYSSNVQRDFEIPLDASVDISSKENFSSISQLLSYILTHFYSIQARGMTIVDALHLYLFVVNTAPTAVSEKEVNFSSGKDNSGIISQFFTDHTLYKEALTISIINATDISGLGTKLAKFISNSGGNVISVTTAKNIENISTIAYFDKDTYTYARFQKILGYKSYQMQKGSISDMIITIGRDNRKDF